eukprot:TRINITY_DN36244_c0_g1_i1.p1 TRINITY_DN36244_c0_g1~~TRINITY_DN36244_c0_g1_i1.p1  ORF type:complete len:410 (+),score=32.91 TRINITY_DN36244_c0_g1_i1:43-1272(+)
MLRLVFLLIVAASAEVYPTKGVSFDIVDLLWSIFTKGELNPPSVAATMRSLPDEHHRAPAWEYPRNVKENETLWDTNHTVTAIREASQRGFKFFRFGATLFWPNQMKLWKTNPALYWKGMDLVFQTAEKYGCQLIPSILWNHFCIADLVGEPLGKLFVPGTKLRNTVKQYVTEIRDRYSHSPALLAWELGNEMNLLADLDLEKQQPAIAPQMGTPKRRTKADNFSTTDMIDFQQDMAGWLHVSGKKNQIPISSGCAVPRANAHHLRISYHKKNRDWTPDTMKQYEDYLVDIHAGLQLVSVHMYPGKGMDRFNKGWGTHSTALLNLTQHIVKKRMPQKGLYLGEYGDKLQDPQGRKFTYLVWQAIVDLGIDMSTLWIWEFGPQNKTYSIWPTKEPQLIAEMQAVNKMVEG